MTEHEQGEEHKHKTPFKTKLGRFHDKHYKLLLLIPLAILILSFVYMGIFYSNNGDFIHRDISLTGGTSVTINDDINIETLREALSPELESLNIREISDIITQEKIAVVIETKSDGDTTRAAIENFLGYELNEENSSFEFTGSALSESFFRQLLIAILLAFIFMAIVVFIIFRSFVPSAAIVISAFADIFMTLVLVNIFGMEMSSAGIIAFLMIIGYSVDTDILLTNKVLKRHEGSINSRIFSAFKTGMTMTLTSLFAVAFALVVVRGFSSILTDIFTILVIGLTFDIFNTWLTNVSIIKWYAKKKGQ